MTAQPAPKTYPETYYAGAYWGTRQESAEECARRAAAFFNLLAVTRCWRTGTNARTARP